MESCVSVSVILLVMLLDTVVVILEYTESVNFFLNRKTLVVLLFVALVLDKWVWV